MNIVETVLELENVTMVCFDRATLAAYQEALAEAEQANG